MTLLGWFHHEPDRPCQPAPFRVLARQPFLSCRRQPVVLRFSIAVRHLRPAGGDPAAFLQTMERGVQRAVIHTQDVLGGPLDMRGDRMAMERAKEQRAQHEHVKRALEKFYRRRRLTGHSEYILAPALNTSSESG